MNPLHQHRSILPTTGALARCSGEFRDPAEESAYRGPRLAETVRHFRRVLWLASSFYFAFIVWDYQQLGWSRDFQVRAAARLGLLLSGLLVAWSLRWVRQPGDLARRTVLFVAVLMTSFVLVVATHPPVVFTHVSMFVVVGTLFMASPAGFAATVSLAVAATLTYLVAVWIVMEPDPYRDFGPLALLFGFVHVIGVLLLRRVNRVSRGQYLSFLAEQRATRALQASEESMRQLFMAVPVPLLLLRVADGRLLKANIAGCTCAGYEASTIGKITVADLFGKQLPYIELAHAAWSEGEVTRRESEMRCADGSVKDVLVAASRVQFQGEDCLMIGITDITERKRLEAALLQLATTDQLTGLCNRHHFFQTAEAELARARRYARPLAVLMLDIDQFKRINDSFGHATGDHVLRLFAGVCRSLLREQDVISRFGGEEFTILLPETPLSIAGAVAERLRVAAEALVVRSADTVEFSFTVSIGVTALLPGDARIDDALLRADSALYCAKHAGRNRVELTSGEHYAEEEDEGRVENGRAR